MAGGDLRGRTGSRVGGARAVEDGRDRSRPCGRGARRSATAFISQGTPSGFQRFVLPCFRPIAPSPEPNPGISTFPGRPPLKSPAGSADSGSMGRNRRTRRPASGGHEDLSPALLDERGRVAADARRRERWTEGALSGLFLAVALAMAVALPRSAPLDVGLAAWLVALCCAVLLIEFDVSAGRTRPVQLVLLPM